jgi:hypothetical protein
MREDAERGTGVNQKTAAGQTVCEMKKLAGDDSV